MTACGYAHKRCVDPRESLKNSPKNTTFTYQCLQKSEGGWSAKLDFILRLPYSLFNYFLKVRLALPYSIQCDSNKGNLLNKTLTLLIIFEVYYDVSVARQVFCQDTTIE